MVILLDSCDYDADQILKGNKTAMQELDHLMSYQPGEEPLLIQGNLVTRDSVVNRR